MQTLKNITNTGTLAGSPALVQSLLKGYTSSSDLTSTGSLVNTTA
jgi:hypothetical protein